MAWTRWIRQKTLRALALALGLVLMLTSCSLFFNSGQATRGDPTSSPAAPAVDGPSVQVVFPGRDDLEVDTQPVEQTEEMTEALPAGAELNGTVDITLVDGSFPDTGATVTFELDDPLAAGSSPAVVHWNEETTEWEPLATTVAGNRMSLSADVEHFSKYDWVDYAFNLVNRATGNYTDPPECPKRPEPVWSDAQFFDDLNGPLLWCVGADEKNDDILEVRVVANRPSAMVVSTAIQPEWAWSDVLGDVSPGTWASDAMRGVMVEPGMTQGYLLPPHGEYRFGFNKNKLFEFWSSGESSPVLIEANADPVTIVAGLAYDAVTEQIGGPSNPVTMLAAAVTIASLVECGSAIKGTADEPSVASAMGTSLSCLHSRGDDIARQAANHIADQENLSWDQAKRKANIAGSRIRSAVKLYALAKGQLALSSVLGDWTLNPIAFQLQFTPSTLFIKERLGGSGQKGSIDELCDSVCGVEGEVEVEHPTWGRVRIITLLPGEEDRPGFGYIAAIDDADKVLWSTKTYRMYYLAPAATAQDATGNVFLDYNPGRYNGVIVLRPTAQGFDDLGTIPTETGKHRFYYASTGEGQDGQVVIWQFGNDCDPSCAQGTITKVKLEWDGNDYASVGPAQAVTTWPDKDYVAPS